MLRSVQPHQSRFVPASRVAPVGVVFWLVKLCSTAFGEAASDAMAAVSPALAVAVGALLLVGALQWQTSAKAYHPVRYWTAVCAVAVFGTMLADGLHVVGLPYPVTTLLYAAATGVVFWWWHRAEGSVSIHQITSRRRERFYWAAVLCTFALGTAVGDLTAGTLNLGYWPSVLVFAALILVPAALWLATRRHEVLWFWCAYVVTRPLGASVADGLAKPAHPSHGLGFGDLPVAVAIGGVLVVLVGLLRPRRTGRRQDEVFEAAGAR